MFNTVNFTLQNYTNRLENRTFFAQGKVPLRQIKEWGVGEEKISRFRKGIEAHGCLV
ncbi:hypothetical protein H6F98_01820 [Microcoleus sp. FACHB-SPT15]|uniref:hypothetical protein n=1 Tax=Microcoleus sp. FACHB-SPT15 TaxID=2692830 RepID=UPI00177E68B2|nr:hypothetical protein [Microcoleus sp. FACHB-SPT15]MBD1804212.1 hypothetical protein [Microcoleus sp. FACHB-SPT15]